MNPNPNPTPTPTLNPTPRPTPPLTLASWPVEPASCDAVVAVNLCGRKLGLGLGQQVRVRVGLCGSKLGLGLGFILSEG